MAGSLLQLLARIGPIVLLTVIVADSASAQRDRSREDIDSAGLVIEASAGWDGTVDRSTAIPVSFLIRNDSDRLIEGEIRLFDSVTGREATLGEVIVSPGTARRFTSILSMTDWFECFATITHGEQVLWRRELPLSTGSEFDPNFNFVLFINDSGRKLQLPGALSGASPVAAPVRGVAEKGRPVKCLTVKTWQVPNHPGPLAVAEAMVFPEAAEAASLNPAQWRAVAEWVCQGGAVFVHSESHEVLDRLTRAAPLAADPALPSGPFLVRRVGLGAISLYSQPLFPSTGSELLKQIEQVVSKLTKHRIGDFLDLAYFYNRHAGRADANRILIVAFFGFYMLFSGVGALLLFRLSRRRIGAYTVIVVVVASVVAGMLGGYLRMSRGDLHWTTVTHAGAGGAVQAGRVEVQSAGGRNTHVAIQGEHTDLQLLSEGHLNRWGHRRLTGYPPFTWQPNLAAGEPDTCEVAVPMTPWGRRRLRATAFRPGIAPLDFKLQFEPAVPPADPQGQQGKSPSLPEGAFSLKLTSRLPFDITNCLLIIGVPHASAEQAGPNQAMSYANPPTGAPATGQPSDTIPIDVYQTVWFHDLAAGTTCEQKFTAQFQSKNDGWDPQNPPPLSIQFDGGMLHLQRFARAGRASAWIIGRIQASPAMTVDSDRSDFVLQDELHFFVQEILPQDMPDASLFVH